MIDRAEATPITKEKATALLDPRVLTQGQLRHQEYHHGGTVRGKRIHGSKPPF